MIKCLLFDIGGVLIDFDIETRFDYLSRLGGYKRSDRRWKAIRKDIEELLYKMELGVIRLDGFVEKAAGLLDVRKSEIGWFDYYRQNAHGNLRMLALVRSLRGRYTLAFLSNIDRSHYRYMRQLLNFRDFRYKFASCYMRMRKPDPEIFRETLKRMHLKSDEVIFIDNQIENVLSARSVGIKALWFRNIGGLRKQLSGLGVSTG